MGRQLNGLRPHVFDLCWQIRIDHLGGPHGFRCLHIRRCLDAQSVWLIHPR
jgi:hypothetical protein